MACRDECNNQIFCYIHDWNELSVFVPGFLCYPDIISLMLKSTRMVTSHAIKISASGKVPWRTWATPTRRQQNISNESGLSAQYSTPNARQTPPIAITARY